jgi:hypothetical protein
MRMKRLVLAVIVFSMAVPAMAFRPTLHRGERVGVLRPLTFDGRDGDVANAVTRSLQRELRARGIDAVDAGITFDDLQREQRIDADYFVEVVSSDADGGPFGGIGVGGDHVGVDISVIVSRVAAQLRLYDGRTLQLIDTYDMQRSAKAVMPTAIGVGGRHVGLWVALPFVHYARYRAAARAVAADAATAIVAETRRD